MYFFKKNYKLAAIALLMLYVFTACGGAEERKAKYMERGKAYFEEENYEKAGVEFKNVLQIDPKSAEPYLYLGRIAEKEKEWRKAFGYYGKAVELDPELVDARFRLGRIYLLAGDLDKATEQVDAVLSKDAENVDALLLRATILMREDKPRESIALLQQLLETAPGDAAAAMLLAAIYKEQEKPDEAVRVLEEAVAENAESADLKSTLAKTYTERKENAKAEVILKGLVSSHPDELKYRFSLASFYTLTDQPIKAEKVLREAIAADPEDVRRYLLLKNFLEKQYSKEKAIAELETAVEANPGLTQLKFLLVDLLLQTEQQDRAEILLRQVIDERGADPDGLKARTALAAIKLQDGKYEEARILIDEVLDKNPGDVQSHYLRGQYYIRVKKYPEAIAEFRVVLKDKPDSGEALTFLASAYYLNGENELALESLLRVTEILPNDVGTRLRVAEIYTHMNRLGEALEQIDYALTLDPASVSILRARAEVLAAQGLTDELEETLTRLEQVSPEAELDALGKGRLLRRQNKFDESLAEFENALEREPDSILILTELVKTQVAMGDTDSAIKRVREVIRGDPDNNAAHVLLGILYASAKDYASAEAEFMRQMKINPKNAVPYVQIARIRFQQGNGEGAIQVVQKGLDELPYDQRLIETLAAIYIQQGELDSAADLYQKSLSYAPDNVAFTIGYAGIMQQQGKYDAAIFAYERLLEKRPGNIIATNNLAALLTDKRTDQQSLQKAKELASKLAETNQPALLDTLGWVHYRLGEYDEAIAVLTDVVEAAPAVPVFNYHLGMAYYKQGNQELAREYLSKAVAEQYTYDGVEEARGTLAKLK